MATPNSQKLTIVCERDISGLTASRELQNAILESILPKNKYYASIILDMYNDEISVEEALVKILDELAKQRYGNTKETARRLSLIFMANALSE